MQDHRKLKVWIRSTALAVATRNATDRFPRKGYSSLRDQMIRSAESIPFNIAEGCGASSRKEFARYLSVSIKSTSELESQLDLSREYGILPRNAWEKATKESEEIRKMLHGLRKKVLGSPQE